MKILALDQSTLKTGFSIFKNEKLNIYGLIDLTGFSNDSVIRCKDLIRQLKLLIEQHGIDYVALEDCQLQKNAQTFKMLARLQGMLIMMLDEYDIPYKVIPPTEWRKGLGLSTKGKRDILKSNASNYVRNVFGITGTENLDDIAEAICIGDYAKLLFEEMK